MYAPRGREANNKSKMESKTSKIDRPLRVLTCAGQSFPDLSALSCTENVTSPMRMIASLPLHSAQSEVPKRGRSKRGRTHKHANERKRAQTQVHKRVQKGAKECKRALARKNRKQPGLKQPGLGTPNTRNLAHKASYQSRTKSYKNCSVNLPGRPLPWSHKPALLNGRFGNCKVGGCAETANPSPTLRLPFANLSPTLCHPFLPTPLQAPLSVGPRHAFRGAG